MENIKGMLKIASLLIFPIVLFIVMLLFLNAKGEFYLFNNYDGPFGHLLSSLSIAQLKHPGFFQHPGIVPQLITAVVIKITFLIQGHYSDIVTDVIQRPEFYFYRIYITYFLLTALSLFILGITIYKITRNIFAGMFLQLTPFISVMVIYQMPQNTSETITIILLLLLISASMRMLNLEHADKTFLYTIIFAVICGLAMANKISILPVLIIPLLILNGFRFKILFLLISFIIFFLLLVLFSPDVSLFFKTLFNNIFKTDTYLSPKNYAEPKQILKQINIIYNIVPLFAVSFLLILVVLILSLISQFKITIQSNRYYKFLVGIFIFMFSFILLYVKTQLEYYIVPTLLFSLVSIFIINSIFLDMYNGKKSYLYVIIIVLAFSYPQIYSYKHAFNYFVSKKEESYKTLNYIKENSDLLKNKIFITTEFCTSQFAAISHGLIFTGAMKREYYFVIKQIYPDYIYFQGYPDFMYYDKFERDLLFLEDKEIMEKKLANSDTLIFQCNRSGKIPDLKSKLEKIKKGSIFEFQEIYSSDSSKIFKKNTFEKIFLVVSKDSLSAE